MTESQAYSKKELLTALALDEERFISSCLVIRDEHGRKRNLSFNPIQKQIYKVIQDKRKKKEPIRLIILKARREGVSTFIQSVMFCQWLKSFYEDRITHEVLLAHKQDSSNYLYDMVNVFYNNLPNDIRPELRYSNQKKLTMFDAPSSIFVTTAEGKGVGVAGGFNLLHMSEFARYEEPEDLMAGIMPTIPDDDPNSMVVLESTAYGAGNMFHRMWEDAVAGKNKFTPLFFAWHDNPEYSVNTIEKLFVKTKEEVELCEDIKKRYGKELSVHQLNWRRQAIVTKCNGDEELFKQDYPSFPEEAFLTSGRPVFHTPTLIEMQKQAPLPKAIGHLTAYNKIPEFTHHAQGPLKIWEYPIKQDEYVIASDFAECNNAYSDFCSACVLNMRTGNQAAVLHGRYSSEEWIYELCWLGYYYNTGLLAPERNAGGLHVVEKLYHDLEYPNIYQSETWDVIERIVSNKIGWDTNNNTKREMIDTTKDLLRSRRIKINDRETINEMIKYRWDDRGRANAPSGSHDDLVISICIASTIAKRHGLNTLYNEANPVQVEKRQSVLWKNHKKITNRVLQNSGYRKT